MKTTVSHQNKSNIKDNKKQFVKIQKKFKDEGSDHFEELKATASGTKTTHY